MILWQASQQNLFSLTQFSTVSFVLCEGFLRCSVLDVKVRTDSRLLCPCPSQKRLLLEVIVSREAIHIGVEYMNSRAIRRSSFFWALADKCSVIQINGYTHEPATAASFRLPIGDSNKQCLFLAATTMIVRNLGHPSDISRRALIGATAV